MSFTRNDLLLRFDSATFARGEAYARKGQVLSLRAQDGAIHAEVGGSEGQVYRQLIKVSANRDGIRFEGSCSCPMAFNCKHVVAGLLASLASSAAAPAEPVAPSSPASSLAPAAELWLRQLALLRADAGQGASPGHRLVYVLMPAPHGGVPQLHVCKARLRKDGSIGGATIHRDLHGLLASMPAWALGDDEEPVRLLAGMRAGAMTGEASGVSGRLGARLLGRLCGEGRLLWADTSGDLQRGRLYPVRPGPVRRAAPGWGPDEADGDLLGLQWLFDDCEPVEHVFPTEPMCYLDDDMLGELALPAELAALPPGALAAAVNRAPALRPHERGAMAARMAGMGLDRFLPLPRALELRERRGVAPVPCLLLDSFATVVRGALRWHDYALLYFDYDGVVIEAGSDEALQRVSEEAIEVIARDPDAERAAHAALAALGFTSAPPGELSDEEPDALQLPAPEAWVAFARHDLPRLRAAGWQVEFDGNYRYELLEPQEWYAELSEEGEDGGAWFALELGIVVEGRRHSLLPLLVQMIRQSPQDFGAAALAARDDGELVVDLPDGARVALPWTRIKPMLSTLGELYFSERMGRALRLPDADAARLAELEQAAQLRWVGGERLRELGRRLRQFDGIQPVEPPAGLNAILRPYQRTGLAWMQFLREYGFGGILADDMGLGKTVQTLAHILAEKEAGRLDAPALVVAPTSLMGNWQAEAARFAPGLRVLLLHGKDRKDLFDQVSGADLVLTTYALLGRDEAALRARRYHLLILDEAQYIKNSRSKASQVVRLIDARHRLCLTGTPVQNHLGELWAQFHFLMPGLLGDEKGFNTTFRKPIEQQGDSLRKDFLARRLQPFMLRRTKDKVATELPPKTEVVLPVEFGAAQRDLYETVRLAMDRKVREEIDRKGLARSQIVILDALLKLRQVCCDPRLLKSAGEAGSAKLDALLELLDTLLSEGRKVLVFSQFTSMLALIGEALRARDVEFAVLTGDTADRAAPIAAFQHGQAAVFLISLKAGGVGLNLTAADTVIHYDPWWNPASENQATDRAWRIGQEQPVFVYKLIARGTLEEKIQELQRRKGELAKALLDPEGGLGTGVNADDLRQIFSVPMS